MSQEIAKELYATKSRLLETIASFPGEDFNTVPFEGSWTAAQVSEHIHKSVSGVLELLYGPVKISSRNPDEKAGAIKDMFLDFTVKFKSPEFVVPGNAPLEKEKIYKDLDDTLTKIAGAIMSLDLSVICTSFELPGFGEFTRTEWIWFGIYHSQRHIRQLEKIREVLTKEKFSV